jgi:hypothetical protein
MERLQNRHGYNRLLRQHGASGAGRALILEDKKAKSTGINTVLWGEPSRLLARNRATVGQPGA